MKKNLTKCIGLILLFSILGGGYYFYQFSMKYSFYHTLTFTKWEKRTDRLIFSKEQVGELYRVTLKCLRISEIPIDLFYKQSQENSTEVIIYKTARGKNALAICEPEIFKNERQSKLYCSDTSGIGFVMDGTWNEQNSYEAARESQHQLPLNSVKFGDM